MSNSIRAIVDVAMTFFPPILANSNSEASLTLQRTIEQFLQNRVTYDQTCAISQRIAGTSQPIERLKKILDTSPEPIPVPDDLRNKSFRGNRRKTRAWSQYEDQRLLAGIYRNGIENWTSISKFVGNARTRSQCSQRWYRGLDPAICKDQWTKEEEQKLLDLIKVNGDKSWTKIASKMGNRSDVQCRYKYRQLQKEKAKENEIYNGKISLTIPTDDQENFERSAMNRIKGIVNENYKSQNNCIINHTPSSSLLLSQSINPDVSKQTLSQTILPSPSMTQPAPIPFYPQQPYVSQRSFIAPSGSCVASNTAGLLQTAYQPPAQLILQPSHSQQPFQHPVVRPIVSTNQQPQQIQIVQQIQPQQIQPRQIQSQEIQPQPIHFIQQIQPQQIQMQPQPIHIIQQIQPQPAQSQQIHIIQQI